MNTFSEIEEYYKAREQQLLKKLHQQEAALNAANQKLKQLTEDQKVSEDETAGSVPRGSSSSETSFIGTR